MNTGALMAAASATSVNKDMQTSMERLSTGKRINSAADDAAGTAIASRLSSEIRGTNQAIRNAMDGQGLINTAEGAHKEIENILQRMRELSTQSANDTNDSIDRTNLQAEITALTAEINRISEATTWAGQKLLTGSGGNNGDGTFVMQVGGRTSAENQITATINAMSAAALGIGEGSVSASADAATIKEIGDNVLQLGGTVNEGDVFSFTVGGVDMAVKLGQLAETPIVLAPSGVLANGTDVSVEDGALTVNAGTRSSGDGDNFIVSVNGTAVEVSTTAGDTDADIAEAIETAIAAKNFGEGIAGVSVTRDGAKLTFAPTTEYQVSTDGGETFGAKQTLDGNGLEAAAGAISAAINGRTSTSFAGLTATAAADGSVTLNQAVNFSAASFDSAKFSASATLNTSGLDFTQGLALGVAGELSSFSYTADAANTIATLATALAGTDEIASATVAANGRDIEIVYAADDFEGVEFSIKNAAATSVTVDPATEGDTEFATAALALEDGLFDINGETVTVKFSGGFADFTFTNDGTDATANRAAFAEKLAELDHILSADVNAGDDGIEIVFANTTGLVVSINDGTDDIAVSTVTAAKDLATATLDTTKFDFSQALSSASLTDDFNDGDINALAKALSGTDEILSATVDGTDIKIIFAANAAGSTSFTLESAKPNSVSVIADEIVAGADAEVKKADVSGDGKTLTFDTSSIATGDAMNFTINGVSFAVTIADDAFADNRSGLIAQVQAAVDASEKLGGLGLTVAADGTDNIKITASANTTTLLEGAVADASASTKVSNGISVATAESSRAAIDAIDQALQAVNTQRANLGAVSNRLDNTVSNLTNVVINLEGGKGRIEDADFAAESTALSKAQILQQASTAMLAQANASKQGVLSLLQG